MVDRLIIDGGTVVLPDRLVEGAAIVVENGRIAAVTREGEQGAGRMIHAAGLYVSPGLIDLHTHGGGGFGFDWDGRPEEWVEVLALNARHGVTGLLATLPVPEEKWETARQLIGRLRARKQTGSRLLGLNYEGPYLNPDRRGAWPAASLRRPEMQTCLRLLTDEALRPGVMTVAPDLPGALPCIETLAASGVRVSLGHSDAPFELAVQAVNAGARHVTHLFNAMSGLNHREPGLAAAALVRHELLAELIADGVHVHPAVMRLAFRVKGPGGMCLITDATPLAGVDNPAGEVKFGQFPVRLENGVCRTPDGALAGSVLTLERAVANAVSLMEASLPEAVQMASLTPARAIGLGAVRGSIEPGKDADLVLFDRDFRVRRTIIAGETVYEG